MENKYDIFIIEKRKSLQTVNCRYYATMVLFWYFSGLPLVLLCLFCGTLMWIHRTFEEGSKMTSGYVTLANIDSYL